MTVKKKRVRTKAEKKRRAVVRSVVNNESRWAVALGDCRRRLKDIPSNSVDAVVTDPPAGIEFMGKEWDSFSTSDDGSKKSGAQSATWHDNGGKNPYARRATPRYQGKTKSSLLPFQDFICEVFEEVYRVLKPGGHALVWAIPRTSHHTTMGLERAGFDVRDVVHHVFGSGFPKSLDVAKAIDKAGGISPEHTAQWLKRERKARGWSMRRLAKKIGCTEASVRDWEEGRARAVGAALEFITPSDRYRKKLVRIFAKYPTDERVVTGKATDRRGDGTVVGLGHSGVTRAGGTTNEASAWQGWGTALKPAAENWILARKPLEGTVAANVLAHGTGALNIDGTRIGTNDSLNGGAYAVSAKDRYDGTENWRFARGQAGAYKAPSGRWPANLVLSHSQGCVRVDEKTWACVPGCAARELDGQGSSRFFYTAKAPTREKWGAVVCGCRKKAADIDVVPAKTKIKDNCPSCGEKRRLEVHPTIKSIALMRYLCRMITPPAGVILDPFAGSGSTGVAAKEQGFRFIGIERHRPYVAIARKRLRPHAKRGNEKATARPQAGNATPKEVTLPLPTE